MTIKIQANEIELIFQKMIQKFKIDRIESLELDTDYYWIVTTDEWDDFDSTSSPSLAVGSLVDDWTSLLDDLKNDQITYLDLERLSSILRALSEKIAPSK